MASDGLNGPVFMASFNLCCQSCTCAEKYCLYICLKATVVLCLSICAAYVEGDIRLVGGTSPLEGRVEVYHNGIWGTVCDNGWDLTEATVVCQQLGHFMAISALGEDQHTYGEGSGPIWYDNLDCTGSETNLTQCSHSGIGQHNCSHMEDAGVVCTGRYVMCDVIVSFSLYPLFAIINVDTVLTNRLCYGSRNKHFQFD